MKSVRCPTINSAAQSKQPSIAKPTTGFRYWPNTQTCVLARGVHNTTSQRFPGLNLAG